MRYILSLLFICVMMAPYIAHGQFNAFEDPTSGGGKNAGPEFEAVEQNIAGGEITLGGTAQIVALFKNTDGRIIEVGDITLYPSSTVKATLSRNQCAEEPLPSSAECAITISVTALQAGTWRVEMLVEHNGRTRLATARITGTVRAGEEGTTTQTDIVATPSEINFETLQSPTSIVRAVTLRNKTSAPLKINNVRMDSAAQGGFKLSSECTETLNPGEGCIAALTWTPIKKGPVEGAIIVEHTGDTKIAQVNVRGNYQPNTLSDAPLYPEAVPGKGLLVSDRAQIDFGAGVDSPSSITATLVNVGDTDLKIESIRLAGSDAGVALSRDGCVNGTILKPIEACPLTFTWLPTRAGPVIDDLQILHSGARGVLVLPIRGTAAAAVSSSFSFNQTQSMSGPGDDDSQQPPPSLNGYTITSYARDRAVITGPGGSQVVRNNQTVVLSGVTWVAYIVPSGIELVSNTGSTTLVFDRSLSANRFGTITSTGTPANSDDN